MNASKTECMTIIIPDTASVNSISGHQIKRVDDFKYLGFYIAESRKDFNTRKGMAWSACIKLPYLLHQTAEDMAFLNIWKSSSSGLVSNLYSCMVLKPGPSTSSSRIVSTDVTPGFSWKLRTSHGRSIPLWSKSMGISPPFLLCLHRGVLDLKDIAWEPPTRLYPPSFLGGCPSCSLDVEGDLSPSSTPWPEIPGCW